MKCPACDYGDTKVVDSRLAGDEVAVRRRRECLKCDFRFSTYEEVEILDLTVIKRDGGREPYSREKIVIGLKRSFEKRPITSEDLRRLVHIVERDIQVLRRSEVPSRTIGEIVMKRLKQVDEVAYIRFASVYQGFTNAEGFHQAIEQLLKRSPKSKSKSQSKKVTRTNKSKRRVRR